MARILAIAVVMSAVCLWAQDEKRTKYSLSDYNVTREHEIKPLRHIIPLKGLPPGLHQLGLTLTVSSSGEVTDVKAEGEPYALKFWPQVRDEVRQWKFVPFLDNGKAATVEVEEWLDLAPPERLPTHHVAAPTIRPDSQITITLDRTGCFGSCPSYTVSISTGSVIFNGRKYVAVPGEHTDRVDADDVRRLARRFVNADFYSMEPAYASKVTDHPAYSLPIEIDGNKKKVVDYVGPWVGMPAVITELEDAVDQLAHTERWIGRR